MFTSLSYAQVVGPILSSLRSDEYLNLYRSLAKASVLVDDLGKNFKVLLKVSRDLQQVHYLSFEDVAGLADLQRTLESMKDPDSIEREMVVRGKIDRLDKILDLTLQ